ALLAAYAVAPWFVSALCRASSLAPFGGDGGTGNRRGRVLRLGVLVAVVGAFVPALALVLVAVGLGLVLGSVLGGGARDAVRALAVAVGAVVVAGALLFPWSLDFVLPGGEWASLAGAAPGPAHAPGLGALLRFQIGPIGAPPLGWALVAAAVAVAAATLPVLAASGGGRWRTPTRDVAQTVSWMRSQASGTSFRVLWLGDPDVLPAPGWRLGPGLAYATSDDGPPDASNLWPGSSNGPTGLIADAVAVARGGDPTRPGHVLA